MVVTHLLQVLAFIGDGAAHRARAAAIGEEKDKVFRSLMPIEPSDVVRGQYEGYRDEAGVAPDSEGRDVRRRCGARSTTGAGPACRSSCAPASAWPRAARIISIAFREPPQEHVPRAASGVGDAGPDHLTFDLADDPAAVAVVLRQAARARGCSLDKQSLQFSLGETPGQRDVLEAYERLIHDAMIGDHTLFTSAKGIERLWEVSRRCSSDPPPVRPYAPGSWGPRRPSTR